MSRDQLPTEALTRAGGFFNESRDFFLAWQVLTSGTPEGEAKQRVPWPVRAPVTCGCMALESALKALVSLDRRRPRRVHCTESLFGQLLPETQKELASLLRINDKPGTVTTLREALRRFDDGAPGAPKRTAPLEAWRYTHEYMEVQHAADVMYAVTKAAHELIVRRRPDFGPWPGIITTSE